MLVAQYSYLLPFSSYFLFSQCLCVILLFFVFLAFSVKFNDYLTGITSCQFVKFVSGFFRNSASLYSNITASLSKRVASL